MVTINPEDPEMERLKGERDDLMVKLSLAQDAGQRDNKRVIRLRRSLELIGKAIGERSSRIRKATD